MESLVLREEMKQFEPKYNVVAASILFNGALSRGDYKDAMETAKICIKIQESDNGHYPQNKEAVG